MAASNINQDFSSDSEGDEDYVPVHDEVLSEEEGSGSEIDEVDSNAVPSKRKADQLIVSEEDRRRRTDALWLELSTAPSTSKRTIQVQSLAPSTQVDVDATTPKQGIVAPEEEKRSQDMAQMDTDEKIQRHIPRQRKSHLLSLARKYGLAVAARLTILEKSKMDWRKHVDDMGDAHTLAHHRKDGYLEKVAFLSRTDDRQADIVRQMKKGKTSRR
ncbi:craniofacial development protein 1-like protein [Phlyctochytrium arcticum]|nr:craniofacial development protein 1-like protein [Phlyctochytrium arcticum]